MKKLLYTAAFNLAFVSSIPVALASGVLGDAKTSHLVHHGAHPNDACVPSATHHFEVHIQGSKFSQLFIDLPEGIKVMRGIEITDQSGQKIDATVSVNRKGATVVFAQPVSSETILTVSMKGIQTPAPGYARSWRYPVYGRSVSTNQDVSKNRLGSDSDL